MQEDQSKPSKRTIANRENGRRGGLATAQNHDQSWLEARASKGGQTLVNLYSSDYFRHINSQRKKKEGWPLGKMRTVASKIEKAIQQEDISTQSKSILSEMLATT